MGLIKETSYDARGPGSKARIYMVVARVEMCVCVCVFLRVCVCVHRCGRKPLHVHTVRPDVAQTRCSFRLLCEASKHLSTSDDVPRLFVGWPSTILPLGRGTRYFHRMPRTTGTISYISLSILFAIITFIVYLLFSSVARSILPKVIPTKAMRFKSISIFMNAIDIYITLHHIMTLILPSRTRVKPRPTNYIKMRRKPSRDFGWEWFDATGQRIELLDWILPIPSR